MIKVPLVPVQAVRGIGDDGGGIASAAAFAVAAVSEVKRVARHFVVFPGRRRVADPRFGRVVVVRCFCAALPFNMLLLLPGGPLRGVLFRGSASGRTPLRDPAAALGFGRVVAAAARGSHQRVVQRVVQEQATRGGSSKVSVRCLLLLLPATHYRL